MQEYKDLLSSFKQYLIQEYPSGSWLGSDRETHQYFRELALKQQKRTTLPPPPKAPQVIPTAPIAKKALPPLAKQEIPKAAAPEIPLESKPAADEKKSFGKSFQPTPMPPTQSLDMSDLRKIIQEFAPSTPLLDQIPNSTPEVVVLLSGQSPQIDALLSNLARAIDVLLAPAAAVHSQELAKLPKPNLLISSETVEGQNMLLLDDASLYLAEPSRKVLLWKSIKEKLTVNR